MMSSDLAQRENIKINYNATTPKFAAINRVELKIDGLANLSVQNLNNSISKKFVIIASPDVLNEVLIGFPQLKELGVISRKFPLAK